MDEAALIAALQEGRLRGAALDVFDGINVFAEPGPPPAHPLYELDNVILTPHCAGSSVESSLRFQTTGSRATPAWCWRDNDLRMLSIRKCLTRSGFDS